MSKLVARFALLLGSTAVFLVLAEFAFRWLGPAADPSRGTLYFADEDYREVDPSTPEGVAHMLANFEMVPGAPRPRPTAKPDTTYRICYRGMDGHEGLDDHGCVRVDFNSCGIRDVEAVCEPKREGEFRIVCLGDSTTVGWGVEAEDTWVRLVETTLRAEHPEVTFVNCGGAGTMLPDEHAFSLRTRFARFQPDLVLVTLCPNDLLPVNGAMMHFDRDAAPPPPPGWWARHSRIVARLTALARERDRTWLDPAHDWVGDMLSLAPADYPKSAQGVGAVYWDSGVPQRALQDIQAWCEEHGAGLGVMLWPFLQQLESRQDHPLTPMHDRLATFCGQHDMPFLDLLDTFLGRDERQLWVSPRDQHGNPRAQRLATPSIGEFVTSLLPR